jgi:general secretion pathway protein G
MVLRNTKAKKKILIIGLFLILNSNVMSTGPNSKIETAKTHINSIITAITAFQYNNKRLPTQEEGLNSLFKYFINNEIPKDPWGRKYIYKYPGKYNEGSFDLYSLGPDGISKTDGNDYDDINNWRESNIPIDYTGIILFSLLFLFLACILVLKIISIYKPLNKLLKYTLYILLLIIVFLFIIIVFYLIQV